MSAIEFEFENMPNDALKEVTDETPPTFAAMTGNTDAGNSGDHEPESVPQTINAGSIIPADIVLNVINILIPMLAVMLIKNIAKRNVNKKQLSATQEEKETIRPVLEIYLNSINFNIENPFNALVLVIAVVYGSKTIEIINTPPQSLPSEKTGLTDTRPAQAAGGRPSKSKNGKPSLYMRKKYAKMQGQ